MAEDARLELLDEALDVKLARKKHQDVSGPRRGHHDAIALVHRQLDELVDAGGVPRVAVRDVDRVWAVRHGQDRRVVEVLGEAPGVDGRGGDQHAEIRAAYQQALEQAQDDVDVEAALVGLVDHQHVVLVHIRIELHLLNEDAVGHHLDARLGARVIVEAHLVSDQVADLRPGLLRGRGLTGIPGHFREVGLRRCAVDGDLVRHRHTGDAPRLGHPDAALHRDPCVVEHARDLGRLSAACRALEYDDGFVAQESDKFISDAPYGEVIGSHQGVSSFPAGLGAPRGVAVPPEGSTVVLDVFTFRLSIRPIDRFRLGTISTSRGSKPGLCRLSTRWSSPRGMETRKGVVPRTSSPMRASAPFGTEFTPRMMRPVVLPEATGAVGIASGAVAVGGTIAAALSFAGGACSGWPGAFAPVGSAGAPGGASRLQAKIARAPSITTHTPSLTRARKLHVDRPIMARCR